MKAIVCVDADWGIGKNNGLLVYNPIDMKYFKEKTLNKYVVMGRKTFESLPKSKPLKDRVNIVITRDKNYKPEGVIVFNSVFDFLNSEYIHEDVYLIGGGQLYKALYNCCEEILVTKLDKSYGADTFFPNLDCDIEGAAEDNSIDIERSEITNKDTEASAKVMCNDIKRSEITGFNDKWKIIEESETFNYKDLNFKFLKYVKRSV